MIPSKHQISVHLSGECSYMKIHIYNFFLEHVGMLHHSGGLPLGTVYSAFQNWMLTEPGLAYCKINSSTAYYYKKQYAAYCLVVCSRQYHIQPLSPYFHFLTWEPSWRIYQQPMDDQCWIGHLTAASIILDKWETMRPENNGVLGFHKVLNAFVLRLYSGVHTSDGITEQVPVQSGWVIRQTEPRVGRCDQINWWWSQMLRRCGLRIPCLDVSWACFTDLFTRKSSVITLLVQVM